LFDIDIPMFLAGFVCYYLAYYWLGAVIGRHLDALKMVLDQSLWAIAAAILFFGLNVFGLSHPLPPALRFVVASSGIWMVLAVCKRFEDRLAGPVVATLDRHSFDIYLLQYFFIFLVVFVCRRLGAPGEVTIVANIVVGLIGPLILVRLAMWQAPTITATLMGVRRKA
jgi:membrane-bound acyltransferase YfiQ involved in biofilm formation